MAVASAEQQRAHAMIAKFGGPCKLRRTGIPDRDCIAGELEFSPRERDLILEGGRHFLISAVGLTIPPNHELDQLVAFGEVLRFMQPVKGPRPNGVPIFYDAALVYDSAA